VIYLNLDGIHILARLILFEFVSLCLFFSGGYEVENQEEKQLLALMEEAYKKANHINMDAKTMVDWLREELQNAYIFQTKEKAL
jgi:hypothetical protein